MFRPDTDLYLLKCPLEMDNNNQLTFANAQAQYNYFAGLPKIEIEASTYQRKDSTVRYPGNIEDLYGYNYCMYRNHNYSNKWFYAYVSDLQWSSEQMTVISLKTDVYQTWQFDLQFKPCFVEREHVNNDAVGLHTVPENFELGEYICNGRVDLAKIQPSRLYDTTTSIIVFQLTTVNLSTNASLPSATYNIFNGIPQGCHLIGVPLESNTSLTDMMNIIGMYDGAGKGEAILSISLMPYKADQWEAKAGTGTLASYTFYVPKPSWNSYVYESYTTQLNSTLNGYTPKNNKLFTYPYNYLYISNNAGANVEYHYEDFFNNEPSFNIYATIEQGGGMFLKPTNSKVSDTTTNGDGWTEGIPSAKLPVLSWASDYYLNWKAVNASNIEVQAWASALNFGASTIGSMLEISNPSYGIGSLATETASLLQQVKQAKLTPPQAKGNINSGDVAYASNEVKYVVRQMSIRSEYAQIIDSYFSAYGYKVNLFKLPNRTGRRNWNYVKTVGCNIEATIPQGDLQEIKGMFNSGITLWHNPATFLDYSQTNNIV